MKSANGSSTAHLIRAVKEAGEDHEYYPTTHEIIQAMINDVTLVAETNFRRRYESFLDIGAGSGKVLRAVRDSELRIESLLAIEKSSILCEQLDSEILIIGTEFFEQSLLSKPVDIIFCNPPYSAFEDWAVKIIRQAAGSLAYLVIPTRWQRSQPIADAISYRDAECHIIGEFDFEDAEDRRTRAQVHLLRLEFSDKKDDAFERFFQEQFADLIGKFEESANMPNQNGGNRTRPFADLVVGPTYPEALISLYDQEMANIERNYRLVGDLDVELLKEFEVSPTRIMECLKQRLSGLRHDYWHELFSHLSAITSRLTHGSRQTLLNTLHKHVQVDFTYGNIYAIILWVIKNANRFIDSQLITVYELMVAKCNVRMYRSNQRTWQEDRWRYTEVAFQNSHYALDYRIVIHRVGGVAGRSAGWRAGLDERAGEFLGDLLTLASNLGFVCEAVQHRLTHGRDQWEPNDLHQFGYLDREGEERVLFDVRGFKNGNLHIRFNQQFILALNVEYGRLKGWLRSASEAADELRDDDAAAYYKSNLQLAGAEPLLALR